MIKNFQILMFAIVLSFGLTVCADSTTAQTRKSKKVKSKTAAPRTITDFYLKLPAKYFPFVKLVKNRRDLIESENLKAGHLNFSGNRAFMPRDAEMLLLKKQHNLQIPMLVVAYTYCNLAPCQAVLHFIEYENGRWSAIAGAPEFEIKEMREIYRRKTGRDADANPYITYKLNPGDKHLIVQMNSDGENIDIYELEWDGNIYDFVTPQE